jgi:hypothetical protein
MPNRFVLAICLVALVLVGVAAEDLPGPHADLPEGFTQLIPRGRIASIDAPVFVSAEQAKIDDEAWVLGVEIDGQAKAYSLNLLNRYEVVNDRFGDRPVAAVW